MTEATGSRQAPLSVAIVGTGFAGIGMAIRLKQAGIHDFVMFEREGRVGGTWRDNTYPGAACDVPSVLYSFSFEPGFPFPRFYARQPDILAYQEHCVRKHGLEAHIRLNCGVRSAFRNFRTSRAWIPSPARASTRRAGTTTWRSRAGAWPSSAPARAPRSSCPTWWSARRT